MKSKTLCCRFSFLLVALLFFLGATQLNSVFAQARHQPPTSDQKKNKRPDQTGEKEQEPFPPDLAGKPQEGQKTSTTTNLVNVDAVVYNKKTGQIISGPKKGNFEIYGDGV